MKRSPKTLLAAILLTVALVPMSSIAQGLGKRVALVIGNSDYKYVPALANPKNDAADMASVLRRLGFEVIPVINGSNAEMDEALERFRQSLVGAQAGLFYYAGHGVQSQGANYLLPVDANIAAEYQLRSKALDAATVLEAMNATGSTLNIVILDACRDNPWKNSGRSVVGSRGLTVMGNAPQGAIIVYATDPGSVAQDGSGRNGTFTEALLRHITTPGLDVKEMLDRVGAEVSMATGRKQNPWVSSKFYDKFYLASAELSSVAEPSAPQSPRPESPSPATPSFAASAAPSAGTAELFVTADREGAEIWVNGSKLGAAGNVFGSLPADTELEVEVRQGYWSVKESLRLHSGELREISVHLELMKANLLFKIATPSAYTVYIDGESFGGLGSGLVKGIPAGGHEAELRAEGMYWKGRIEARPEATVTVNAEAWEVGGIVIDAPAGAEVKISKLLSSGSKAKPYETSLRGGQALDLVPVGNYSASAGGPGFDRVAGSISVSKGRVARWKPWTGGSLVVSTDPPGLEVSVGGIPRGKSPLSLSGLEPGYISLVIDHREWKRIEQTKAIELGKTAQVAFVMQPRPAILSIDIPADATFRVYGASYSRSGRGPASLDDVPTGSYTIEAGGSGGYESYTSSLALGRGEERSLRPWTGGSLVVTTEPPGLDVQIDGRSRGRSPLTLTDLAPGTYSVSAAEKDYFDALEKATVQVGKKSSVALRLAMNYARLEIDVPSDAWIAIEGRESRSGKGPGVYQNLPPGSYSVRIGGSGYETYTASVELGAGASKAVKPWSFGELLVDTDPPGFEVVVEGRAMGRSPVSLSDLKPGYVNVLIDDPEWKRIEQKKLIEVGRMTQVAFVMQPKPAVLSLEIPADAPFRISGSSYEKSGKGPSRLELPTGGYTIETGGSAGYESYRETIQLGRGEERSLRPWTSGSLRITTDPQGAQIFVDGRAQGQSPLTLSDIKTSSASIIVRLEGYEEESHIVQIDAGRTVETAYKLSKVPEMLAGMVNIPGGSFLIGSSPSEPRHESNEEQHTVNLSPFAIGMFEVTQGEWKAVMGWNPSEIKGNDLLPVENVSWYDTLVYCNARSLKEGLVPCYSISGKTDPKDWGIVPTANDRVWNDVHCDFLSNGYRLPTEAEWEYACRAGTTTATSFGDSLVSARANFNGGEPYNSSITGQYFRKTVSVDSYEPNAWNLFNMHGNVWEWCWDWYTPYVNRKQTNPKGAVEGKYKVVRGGAWYTSGYLLRSAYRGLYFPEAKHSGLGFRVVANSAKKAELSQRPAMADIAVGGLVRIPAGTFTMGSPGSEKDRSSDESPQHEVQLSAFSIGQYEVTQGEWKTVMGSNPSYFTGDDRLPVESVSWYEILVYCNKRSMKDGLVPCYSISGTTDPNRWGSVPTSPNSTWNAVRCDFTASGYRLPTEAEWEYACRSGTTTATAFGNTLVSSQSNFDGNRQYNVSTTGAYLNKTAPVGSYAPNPWGLYDMHGNVWERCWDWYDSDYYSRSPTNDPKGADSGSYRVLRGGSWSDSGVGLRSAYRCGVVGPSFRYLIVGFRVVVGGQR